MIFCPACGAQNHETARFCARCGAPLPAPQRREPEPPEHAPPPRDGSDDPRPGPAPHPPRDGTYPPPGSYPQPYGGAHPPHAYPPPGPDMRGLDSGEQIAIFLGSLCVSPIVAIVLYFVWREDKPRKAQEVCTLGYWVVGVWVSLYALFFLLAILLD